MRAHEYKGEIQPKIEGVVREGHENEKEDRKKFEQQKASPFDISLDALRQGEHFDTIPQSGGVPEDRT